MDPKQNSYMLSKEDFLVCAFYKLEYPSCLAGVLPKILKKASSPCFVPRTGNLIKPVC
jgi:hypothetical protein